MLRLGAEYSKARMETFAEACPATGFKFDETELLVGALDGVLLVVIFVWSLPWVEYFSKCQRREASVTLHMKQVAFWLFSSRK